MKKYFHDLRVLSIAPNPKGFGFAVIEGRDRLVDWGVARVWARARIEFVARVDASITRYRPALIVLPEIPSEPHRARTARRLEALHTHARAIGMPVVIATRDDVRATFPTTRQARAVKLAEHFPELMAWLPRERRPWMTEDERMYIFDAIALTVSACRLSSCEEVVRE